MYYIFLADGFEEVEALTSVDILRRAGVKIKTVACKLRDRQVIGAHGIKVEADIPENEVNFDDISLVILPGGMPGSVNLNNSACVQKALTSCKENGGLICAICAAPFILGERGDLKGKCACCYPGFEEKLIGARVQNKSVVTDGNFITGNGPASAMEFALAICEKLCTKEVAEKVKRDILWKN